MEDFEQEPWLKSLEDLRSHRSHPCLLTHVEARQSADVIVSRETAGFTVVFGQLRFEKLKTHEGRSTDKKKNPNTKLDGYLSTAFYPM